MFLDYLYVFFGIWMTNAHWHFYHRLQQHHAINASSFDMTDSDFGRTFNVDDLPMLFSSFWENR